MANKKNTRDELRSFLIGDSSISKKTVYLTSELEVVDEKEAEKREDVEAVEVREPTAGQRAKLFKGLSTEMDVADSQELMIRSIILLMFDPNTGDNIFEDTDYDALSNMPGHKLDVLGQEATSLMGESE